MQLARVEPGVLLVAARVEPAALLHGTPGLQRQLEVLAGLLLRPQHLWAARVELALKPEGLVPLVQLQQHLAY
jgi:hypothetical protein